MKNPALVRKYRLLDHDLAEFSDQLHGGRAYEATLLIPDSAHRQIMQAKLDALKKRIDALETPDPVFVILKSHYRDFFEAQQMNFERAFASPAHALRFLAYSLRGAEDDSRDDALKAEILQKKLAQAPALWEALAAECTAPAQRAELYHGCLSLKKMLELYLPALEKAFPALDKAAQEKTAGAAKALLAQAESWAASVADAADAAAPGFGGEKRPESATLPKDIEGYRKQLVNLGVDLDELVSWHEEELEKTRNECLAIASRLDIPEAPAKTMREVNDILLKYAGPAATPEEMFARANQYIKRTRAIAHEYVWLPEDEQCLVNPVPLELKDTYPWGGYGGGCKYRRPMLGGMFLNNFNHTAITDGWIKINCLHESYPGHHVQWIRKMTDPIPETFKMGARDVPLMEGTCIRTERAFEFVYADDPFYPLFVAYRRHHGTVRIRADLLLHYYGKTVGDALRLYQDELGLDYRTARMQVETNEHGGYYTAYYYGLKKLEDWQQLYGYDKKTFTGLLFAVGGISMENFERFLQLDEEDKHRLTHDFGSLYQFD